jgi:hypothetical protein
MPRTKPEEVIEVLGSNYDDINEPSLKPYIKGANLIVSRVVTCAEERDITISDDEAREMERWVAAYLYTINDPIYKSKQTANSSAVFNDRSYLDGAFALDPSGCLRIQIKGTSALMGWLGKTPSEQIDVDDRD